MNSKNFKEVTRQVDVIKTQNRTLAIYANLRPVSIESGEDFMTIIDGKFKLDLNDFSNGKGDNAKHVQFNLDIKDIKLENKNNTVSNYMIVLEESNNYDKYKISKKLPSKYINYNIYVNGNKIINNVLDKKLDNTSGIKNGKNNYLIYEGKIDKLSELTVKVGMWVSYEDITNEYMNSGFVGTMKVYIESK